MRSSSSSFNLRTVGRSSAESLSSLRWRKMLLRHQAKAAPNIKVNNVPASLQNQRAKRLIRPAGETVHYIGVSRKRFNDRQ
jgi:predicted deacetylase